jgi:hypothetical protein
MASSSSSRADEGTSHVPMRSPLIEIEEIREANIRFVLSGTDTR